MRNSSQTRNRLEVSRAKAAKPRTSTSRERMDQPTAAPTSGPEEGPSAVWLVNEKLPPTEVMGTGGNRGTAEVELRS